MKFPPWETSLDQLMVHHSFIRREHDRIMLLPEGRILAARCASFHSLLTDWRASQLLVLTFEPRQIPTVVRIISAFFF